MANPMQLQLNEEFCPVSDEIFGRLRQASPSDAVKFAQTLPRTQCAQLAVFCYRRRHLHELGLMIASICERSELVDAAGASGMIIFDQDYRRIKSQTPLRWHRSSSTTASSIRQFG